MSCSSISGICHLSNQRIIRLHTNLYTPILLFRFLYSTRAKRNDSLPHSTPIFPDPQAPEPLPQLPPRPARAPMDTLLPLRVLLPVAHGSRLAFDAHRSPLGGGLGHFDCVSASFGCVPGVEFVLLEGLFDGVGGLAFAFEVFGEILLVGGCVSIVLGESCKG